MASPSQIRELRFQVGTTHRTAMLNAGADGDWNIANASVHKARVTSVDVSGLTQPGIDDETLQTRMHAKPPMIAGLRKGSIKFQCYAGGANATAVCGPEWNAVGALAGGFLHPTNRSGLGTTTSGIVNIGYDDSHTITNVGAAVLCGVKGDGRGGGEVRPMNALSGGYIGLSVATAASVGTGDTLVFGTTIYPDEDATQQYLDLLAIGHASADQVQAIGAAGSFTITGTGIGEIPKIDFDCTVTDWQHQPSGSRASLAKGTAPDGGNPSFDKGIGAAHIGDHGTSTRSCYKVTDVTFNPGIAYEEIPAPCAVNGVGGFQHMPGVPILECTILTDEDDGLLDDYPDTAKAVLIQMGHTATKCIAIELPKAYLDEKPTRVEVNNLTGWRLKFHGTEDYVADDDLRSAAWRIHVF